MQAIVNRIKGFSQSAVHKLFQLGLKTRLSPAGIGTSLEIASAEYSHFAVSVIKHIAQYIMHSIFSTHGARTSADFGEQFVKVKRT